MGKTEALHELSKSGFSLCRSQYNVTCIEGRILPRTNSGARGRARPTFLSVFLQSSGIEFHFDRYGFFQFRVDYSQPVRPRDAEVVFGRPD